MSDQLPHGRKYCHLAVVNQIDHIIYQSDCLLQIRFSCPTGSLQVSVSDSLRRSLPVLDRHDAQSATSGP